MLIRRHQLGVESDALHCKCVLKAPDRHSAHAGGSVGGHNLAMHSK